MSNASRSTLDTFDFDADAREGHESPCLNTTVAPNGACAYVRRQLLLNKRRREKFSFSNVGSSRSQCRLAPRLRGQSHRLHGGDHVDYRISSCAFSCDVGCLYHRALGSQGCGRTGIGRSATTSHLHDPIPALRAKHPHRRPRAAQEIFSPGKGRWARARIALSQPNRHGRREAAERRGNDRLASTRDCVSHRSGAYDPRDHRWATRLVWSLVHPFAERVSDHHGRREDFEFPQQRSEHRRTRSRTRGSPLALGTPVSAVPASGFANSATLPAYGR